MGKIKVNYLFSEKNMADEKKYGDGGEELESNAARRLRLLGVDTAESEEEHVEVNKLANFWHYNRTKIIIISFFVIVFGIVTMQTVNRQNPDISILYAGPDYITPNECKAFSATVESIIEDYNSDGRKYVQIDGLVFMSDDQIEDSIAAGIAADERVDIDNVKNKEVADRFSYEVFGGEALICILAEDQFRMVEAGGGFMKLTDVLGETPVGAIDEYGVRFSETKFCKFYDSAKIFPDDAVIALRTIPTTSAITGKKRAEKLHEYHTAAFKLIIGFEYPEGYSATD